MPNGSKEVSLYAAIVDGTVKALAGALLFVLGKMAAQDEEQRRQISELQDQLRKARELATRRTDDVERQRVRDKYKDRG